MRDGQPSKLRLGLFLASLAGGGLEKTMLTLAAGLADRGHSVTLLPCRDAKVASPTSCRLG